jgi:hypothetical protein
MAEMPLPTFTKKTRPSLSVDEILAKGREAAAATGQIITGDTPPPPPVPLPALELAAPPAAPAPATEPVEQEQQEPVASPVANTGGATGKAKRRKTTARIGDDKGRVVWQSQIRPDFLLHIRTLALHRNVSPYDVLDDALAAYLRDHAPKR